jgi:hypothetical protein
MKLAKQQRKGFLVLHIVSSGVWVGMDIVMGILVFIALSDAGLALACYQALAQFAVWPMLITGVLCLVSGVVLGLGSKYGLVRYWWVAVKLVLNVVLCVLVLVALRPGVLTAAAGGPAGSSMLFPPIVSTTTLIFATVLSVFKPWGRVRQRAYRQSRPVTDAPTRAMAES